MAANGRRQFNWILGSASPRRVELLSLLQRPFNVVKPQIVEQQRPGEDPAAYAQRNSREKAQEVLKQFEGMTEPVLIVSADTIVVVDGRVLEKPADAGEATTMLMTLSGREHLVMTGLTVCAGTPDKAEERTQVVKTKVRFKTLSQTEIQNYVKSGEPMDKAGAYGAQGVGACFIQSIEGSYTNVVGLPMAELTEVLSSAFSCYP